MESALTPREIQARIRGGESAAEVAEAAGVPVEKIDVYAGPVLAEREHAAMLARSSQVRRRGESSTQRLLGDVVADSLAAHGVEPDQIAWDAWRDEERRWTIQAAWTLGGVRHCAQFDFNQRGRYSAASDDDARVLIDERPPAVGRPGDPDTEPTIDLNDELAIVRVLQDHSEPPAVRPDVPSARIIKLPGAIAAPPEENEPEDYSPAELVDVDGVFDILPNPRSDMDVLYDMLAGFNEDSVRIYTGLTQPVSTAPEQDFESPQPERPAPEPPARTAEPGHRGSGRVRPASPRPTPPDQSAPRTTAKASSQPTPRVRSAKTSEAAAPSRPAAPDQSSTTKPRATELSAVEDGIAKPGQEALVSGPEPKPAAKPATRRKRASVPTWDEIMFGGPQPPK